jgi:putative tricarboxylic transport membrane protein
MNMNTDRVSFSGIFILALYGTVSSSLMPLGQLQEPGPGFFPLALSAILLALSGLGILSARPSAQDLSRLEPFWGDMKTPFKIVLATGLAVFAFEPVGFLITSSCFLVSLFLWVSRYPLWKAIVFGVVGGFVGWLCFVKLLGVPMPGGFLG